MYLAITTEKTERRMDINGISLPPHWSSLATDAKGKLNIDIACNAGGQQLMLFNRISQGTLS